MQRRGDEEGGREVWLAGEGQTLSLEWAEEGPVGHLQMRRRPMRTILRSLVGIGAAAMLTACAGDLDDEDEFDDEETELTSQEATCPKKRKCQKPKPKPAPAPTQTTGERKKIPPGPIILA